MNKNFECIFINMCNYTRIENSVIPIGQLSLASYITHNIKNANAKVIDLNYIYSNHILEYKSDNIRAMIADTANYILEADNKNVHLVSIYTMWNTHHYAILLAERLKSIRPNLVVCLAGPQASITAEETLKKYNCVDFIGIGEGELTIEGIINAIKHNDFSKCEGVAYRKGDQIVVIPNKRPFENLDKLPFIDYTLLNFIPSKKMALEVGRGCPFDCSFCSTNNFWMRKYRVKSADRIFNEIKIIHKEYGIESFSFEHDIFLIDRENVLELCENLINWDIKIDWGCSSRLDYIDEILIKNMSYAGCRAIYFGIETGSQFMQEKIGKKLDLSRIWKVLDLCRNYKITPTFSFIYGFNKESETDIEETLKLMYNLYEYCRIDYFKGALNLQLHKLIFLPGTREAAEVGNNFLFSFNPRTDVQQDETHWNDKLLIKMIKNQRIFPQFYGIEKIEHTDLLLLDAYAAMLFLFIIEYIDSTYMALLLKFKKHISIFHDFIRTIGKNEFNSLSITYGDGTLKDNISKFMTIFKKYIELGFFSECDEYVKDIFKFEYAVYYQKHAESISPICLELNYDVIKIKKERKNIVEKCKNRIYFIPDKSGNNIKIKREFI